MYYVCTVRVRGHSAMFQGHEELRNYTSAHVALRGAWSPNLDCKPAASADTPPPKLLFTLLTHCVTCTSPYWLDQARNDTADQLCEPQWHIGNHRTPDDTR